MVGWIDRGDVRILNNSRQKVGVQVYLVKTDSAKWQIYARHLKSGQIAQYGTYYRLPYAEAMAIALSEDAILQQMLFSWQQAS